MSNETFGQYILTNPDNGSYEFYDAYSAVMVLAEIYEWDVEISYETRDTGFGTERKWYFTIPIICEDPQEDVKKAKRIISQMQI